MKKMRFTAVLLCVTTLFALFTGSVYANDGSVYISETTLVIEDGKVVSGDKSLVENGYIVIGEASTAVGDGDAYVAEDYGAGEVTPTPENTEEGYVSVPDTAPQSSKQPVKDNSALVTPNVTTPSVPENSNTLPQVSLPTETPTAVTPNVPGESAKVVTSASVPCLGYKADQTDSTYYTQHDLYMEYLYIEMTQEVAHYKQNISTMKYYMSKWGLGCTMYRLNSFDGMLFDVKAGKTFTIEGNEKNGNGDTTIPVIDGRTVSRTSSGNLPTSPSPSVYTSSNSMFHVAGAGAELNLYLVTIQNGSSTANGAGIYIGASGTANLTNCTIDNCDTTGNGGGIYIEAGGILNMDTVTIQNCSAKNGGAIYVAGAASITLKDVKIGATGASKGNYASEWGGGVYLGGGSLELPSNSYINDNKAQSGGGGIYVAGGTFTLSGGRVGFNFAQCGAGVFVAGGTFEMTGGELRDNKANISATSYGGGICSYASDTTPSITYAGAIKISGGKIFNNTSNANGAGMWIGTLKSFDLTGGDIYSNTSGGNGGAMFFNSPTETLIKINGNSAVVNIYSNTASVSGGGIVFGNFRGDISAEIGTPNPTNRVTIRNNTATNGAGGGICLLDDEGTGKITVTVKHADIYANSAKTMGGGVQVGDDSEFVMQSGSIGYTSAANANTAPKGAGISITEGGTFEMTGASIRHNHATLCGGGLYSEGQTTINITGGSVNDNICDDNGGGIYIGGTNADGVRIVASDNSINIYNNTAKNSGIGGGGGICVSNDDRVSGQEYHVTGVVIGGGTKAVNIYKNTAIYGGGIRFLNSGYGLMSIEIKGNTNIYENTATASSGARYKGGGGIFVGGNSTLTIDGADIYRNIVNYCGAGMVIAGGDVTFKSGKIRDHSVEYHGAGIEMAIRGSLTMEGGEISNNSSGYGGGIHLVDDCTLTVSGGEIKSNSSTVAGGGIAQGGGSVTISGTASVTGNSSYYGGGLYTNGGSLTVSGGSVSNNSAKYGAGFHIDDNTEAEKTVTFSGGTVSGNDAEVNGGGIWLGVFKSFSFSGCTVSNNTADKTGDSGYGGGMYINRGAAKGTLSLLSGTISGNSASYSGGGIYFGNSPDGTKPLYAVLGTAGANANARAGEALSINGNSAVVGGGICIDDGSAAHQPVEITIYNGVDIYDNDATVSGGGIYGSPSAVILMNGGKIRGNCVTYHQGDMEIGGGGIHIYKGTLTITGGEISGNSVINNGTKTRGLGGGIYAQDLVTISIKGTSESPVILSDNTANYRGGGLYIIDFNTATTPIFEMDHVTITGNTAKYDRGGGVFTDFETATGTRTVSITNCRVENNTSELYDANDDKCQGHGGGIYLAQGVYTINNVDFIGNHATVQGAGLYCSKFAQVSVSNCTFTDNESKGSFLDTDNVTRITVGSGGGMAVYSGAVVTLQSCSFDGNSAATDGGAIGLNGNTSSGTNNISSLTLTNVTIGATTANTAAGNGGGINQGPLSVLTVNNCNVNGNQATGTTSNGGGICSNSDTAKLAISNTEIANNTAYQCGGGLYVKSVKGTSGDTVILSGLTITDNIATMSSGGGIYSRQTGINLTNSTISGNEAYRSVGSNGGGICFEYSTLNVSHCEFIDNKASGWGGGLYATLNATVDIQHSEFDGNEASRQGGGLATFNGVNATVFETYFGNNTASGVDIGGDINGDGAGGAISILNDRDKPGTGTGCTLTLKDSSIGCLLDENNKPIDYCTNTAKYAGGGMLVSAECTVNFQGNVSVCYNKAGSKGGGISFTAGSTINFGSTEEDIVTVSNNSTTGLTAAGNGGGIYTGAGFTVTNLIMTGNTAAGSGGAIYVDNAVVNINTPTPNEDYQISYNTAQNGNGGGACVKGANGKLTMTNCRVIGNTASGSYSGDTAKVAEGSLVGAGGGVAVFDGGNFKFIVTKEKSAIYRNTASTAGDDVFANGNGTSLTLPAATDMDKTYTDAKDGLWMEDYLKNDSSYTAYGLNGNSKIVMRYRETPVSIRAFASTAEGTSPSGEYINDSGEFVAITFGVPKYNVGSIKVTAPQSDNPTQRFVFTVEGTNSLGETVKLSVSLLGGESVTITNLLSGTYTVTQQDDWSWRYEFKTVKVDENDPINTNGAEVTITGTELDEVHTVVYGNEQTKFNWLSHNSVAEKNVPPISNVTARIDMAEFKKSYIV